MILVLEDAALLRQRRLNDPNREPDETTEDDVIEALLIDGYKPLEVLHRKGPYTRALRLMLKGGVDRQM